MAYVVRQHTDALASMEGSSEEGDEDAGSQVREVCTDFNHN